MTKRQHRRRRASGALFPAGSAGLWTGVAGLVVLSAGLAGCSAISAGFFSPRVRECDGFTVPLSVLAASSRKELRVRIVGSSVEQDVPFVVESSKEALVLIGFTPLGTKSFTLERHGDEVKVENVVGAVQPIPPKNIMADVLAMSLPSACSPTTDGKAEAGIEGWFVEDECQDGRPIHRRVGKREPGKSEAPKFVEVDYTGDSIFVHQRKCRYSARYVLQAVAKPAPKKKAKKTEVKKSDAKKPERKAAPKPPETKPAASAATPATAAPPPAAAKPAATPTASTPPAATPPAATRPAATPPAAKPAP